MPDHTARSWQEMGAATRIESEPEPIEPPAPVVNIRGYIPDYLDQQLAIKAAERRVTKTFLIMEALGKAGYRIEEDDLVQDRRKSKKDSGPQGKVARQRPRAAVRGVCPRSL